ncbi:MAG TPA: FAD-dependent oxidoreductase [Candidatus Thermoplasmatota archaeon]|nr:FAD-dependent oxidoreductase [Candidatus Thermoplasmatota archaeon]
MNVLVVGAGVSGLSSALRLLQDGHHVVIRARERSPRTVSDVAAAVYFPYLAHPVDRVLGWGKASYEAFKALARSPETGVHFADIVELYGAPVPDPWWRDMVGGYRRARPEKLPPGYRDGIVASVPVIEMPRYLRYLETRFLALGGKFQEGTVARLADLAPETRVAVNCTGLAAGALVPDPEVFPIRGQIVRVRNPGLTRAYMDEEGPRGLAYVIPRSDCVVLGGTAEVGSDDLTPREETEQEILGKAREIEPRLGEPQILSRAVGLRPGRTQIRLEAEAAEPGFTVVHNYGHGGAGVTLSWGCADEVASLVRRLA